MSSGRIRRASSTGCSGSSSGSGSRAGGSLLPPSCGARRGLSGLTWPLTLRTTDSLTESLARCGACMAASALCAPPADVATLALCLWPAVRSVDGHFDIVVIEAKEPMLGDGVLLRPAAGAMDAPTPCSIAEEDLPRICRSAAASGRRASPDRKRGDVALLQRPSISSSSWPLTSSSSRQEGGHAGKEHGQRSCNENGYTLEDLSRWAPSASPPPSPSPPHSPRSPLLPEVSVSNNVSPQQAAGALRKLQLQPHSPRALAGLQNLGNTCFMNACVQCLSNSAPIALFFLHRAVHASRKEKVAGGRHHGGDDDGDQRLGSCKGDCRRRRTREGISSSSVQAGLAGGCSCDVHLSTSNGSGTLHSPAGWADGRVASASGISVCFGDVLRQLWSAKPMSSVCPRELLASVQSKVPHFAGYRQHDSQDFLRSLVDKLDEECNQAKQAPACMSSCDELDSLPEAEQACRLWQHHRARHASPIQDIFCGQLQSTIECHQCQKKSFCFDPFLDLSLPIPKKTGNVSVSLQDCLADFMMEERLEGDNAYNCGSCKSPQPAAKMLSIFRFPPLLVLHLKRISQTGLLSFTKDTSLVRFPLDGLDLRAHLSMGATVMNDTPPPIYDLYAVCNHTGSMHSGHYTAVCKNVDDSQWYSFNDAKVQPLSSSLICSSAAYVLFYQRRDG